jgi:hypothetical protein
VYPNLIGMVSLVEVEVMVLGMGPRALHMLGKCFTTELNPAKRLTTGTKWRTCEGTARRWPYANQGVGPREKPTLLTP